MGSGAATTATSSTAAAALGSLRIERDEETRPTLLTHHG